MPVAAYRLYEWLLPWAHVTGHYVTATAEGETVGPAFNGKGAEARRNHAPRRTRGE